MIFWDASAIIPLCIEESRTKFVKAILKKDDGMVVWWGSLIECYSAYARLRRDGFLNSNEEDQIRRLFAILSDTWTEIEPSEDVRLTAGRLLLLHPLRAADSLQLAAALIWAGKTPMNHNFMCFDIRLREAARNEGFSLLPNEI